MCRYPPQSFLCDVVLDGIGYEMPRYLYATSNLKLHRFSFQKVNSNAWSETSAFVGFIVVSIDEQTACISHQDITVEWHGTVMFLALQGIDCFSVAYINFDDFELADENNRSFSAARKNRQK
jgi:hypothetical protein